MVGVGHDWPYFLRCDRYTCDRIFMTFCFRCVLCMYFIAKFGLILWYNTFQKIDVDYVVEILDFFVDHLTSVFFKMQLL